MFKRAALAAAALGLAVAAASAQSAPESGYAPVHGLRMYYEIRGSGQPLVLLHGGVGAIEMFGPILPALAAGHRVIAVDLQAHGRTADIDRPLRVELLADDVAALLRHLGIARADLMGYSLGGAVALQDAEPMKQTPMYQLYAAIAPRPQDWPVLLAKFGDGVRQDYDWSREVAALQMPVLIVAGDADAVRTAHLVEFFALLGGAQRDAGWDGSGRPRGELVILPGATHYDIFSRPELASTALRFLDAPMPAGK